MNRFWIVFFLFLSSVSRGQKPDFSNYPIYKGKDLGLSYSPTQSFFRIWSPTATEVKFFLYKNEIVLNCIKNLLIFNIKWNAIFAKKF